MSTWTTNTTGRLDVVLASHLPDYSRSKLQKYIEAGQVLVNQKVIVSPKQIIVEGDILVFQEPKGDPLYPLSEDISLTILFEDDDILAINKPVGMVVHPNDFHSSGTLVQAILHIRPDIEKAVYDAENPVSRLRPGIVHRLDKDTSGVILVAKTGSALANLAEQFQNHSVKKEYATLLYGQLTRKQTVDAPLQRKGGGDKNRMGASHDPEQGRAAITHLNPIKSWAPYASWPHEYMTYARVHIETGRTHQIRVHAKFIGHPVMGDSLYGNKPSQRLSEKLGMTHQMLHAASITFTHPTSGIIQTVEAPLTENFSNLLSLT